MRKTAGFVSLPVKDGLNQMSKILLVEDDQNLSEIYEARLSAEGYEIVSAANGEDALAIAAKEKPDLVISDVMMPRVSGFEMLDILRHTDGMQAVKTIMLTALGQDNDRSKASELGADRYLVKSQVTLEDIVNTAKELLGDEAPASETATPATPATPVATSDSVAPPPSHSTSDTPVSAQNTPAAQTNSPTPLDQPANGPQPLASNPNQTTGNTASSLAKDEADLAQTLKTGTSSSDPVAAPATASTPPVASPTIPPTNSDNPVASAPTSPIANPPQPAAPLTNDTGAPTPAASSPAPPEPTNGPSHDQVLADALKQLEDESTPSTPPANNPATSNNPQNNETSPTSSQNITGHKIIQPPSETEAKPDINQLLAQEEQASGTPPPPPSANNTSASGSDKPNPSDPGNIAL